MVRKRDDKIYDKKPSPFNGTGEILVMERMRCIKQAEYLDIQQYIQVLL